jgi:hypothetical protein
MVTRLAEGALKRLPDDPARLGEILHGMGEIAARCHAPTLSNLFVDHFKARHGQVPLEKVFDAALERDSATARQVRVGELALGQWLSRATLEWSTFEAAVSHIEHPTHVLGRFGLAFAARAILCTEPCVIDNWIATHADHPAVSVIGSAALMMVFPFDDKAAIGPLLESKTVGIKCLGAASIVCPVGLEPSLSFRDCHKALVAAGFAPADATWMTGMRIKNAVHARFRIEYDREQSTARVRYLEQNPDKAVGGIRNAQAEITMLHARLDRAEEAYAKLLPDLEALLCDMAADWPTSGLVTEQMQSLEFIFVGTAEIRHRLAAKLSHQANRDWLLKQNIARLQDLIGLEKRPEDVPKDYFLPDEPRFPAITHWTAQSLILRYDGDSRGVGYRTSDIVAGVAVAAEKLIAQPFISGRQPEIWQSIITRAACAGRFAFSVVANTPEHRRHTVVRLNELALDHAFKLLSARNLPAQSAASFYQLTAQAVQHMEIVSNPDEVREKWALAGTLDDLARALALWSSPPLVERHRALACDLFERVCVPPTSRSAYNLQMSRMLTLLDIAVASGARIGKSDLIDCVRQLWTSSYHEWLAISGRWQGIAEKLILAVQTNGPERAEIIADAAFVNSYCRRLIDNGASTTSDRQEKN